MCNKRTKNYAVLFFNLLTRTREVGSFRIHDRRKCRNILLTTSLQLGRNQRETEKDRERQRETEGDRESQRESEIDRERQRETKREHHEALGSLRKPER